MKRNFLYISLLSSLLLAFTACSNEEHDIPVDQKTPIQLSVGTVSGSAVSRAITVAPTNESLKTSFSTGTTLYMVMKSENKDADAKWTLTKGTTVEAETGKPNVSFGSGCMRYWDDAHSRDAQLSIYSVCTPGGTPNTIKIDASDNYTPTGSSTRDAWSNTANNLTIANWEVKNDQSVLTATTFADQDLCYSNNVSKYKNGSADVDARIKFDTSSKKFGQGDLYFYHALSKITFIIQKGASFTADEFKFADNTNITMEDMNIKNTSFDLATGEFSSATNAFTKGSIDKMYLRESKDDKYTLDALVLPGTDINNDTNKDAISFTIANNIYQLSWKDLYDKISTDDKTNKLNNNCLKPGVHYTFTLTVSKTQVIRITASLVDWQTVTASAEPSNAHLTITTTKGGSDMTDNFDLYRLKDQSTVIDTYQGYNWAAEYKAENKNQVLYDGTQTGSEKWKLSTPWYWDNNMTYYHFRSVAPTGTTITHCRLLNLTSAEATFTDIIWGAPFVSGITQFTYDKESKGFDGTGETHQIHYAIGPTNDAINLTMFHMMSKVAFNLKTTTGDDKVTLGNGTKITLKNVRKNGTVAMGNGLVNAVANTNDADNTWTFTQTPSVSDNVYSWSAGIVPQSLADVVLVITTPDNNQYEIALKDVEANTVTAANISIEGVEASKAITYWYPCFEYTYTITLKKTGIEKITATLVDWQKVSADNQTVVIK